MRLAPREKFAATTAPTPESSTALRISASRSCQPVVPTTRLTPAAARRGSVARVASAVEKSTATSTSRQISGVTPCPSAFESISRIPATSNP